MIMIKDLLIRLKGNVSKSFLINGKLQLIWYYFLSFGHWQIFRFLKTKGDIKIKMSTLPGQLTV